MTAPRLWLANMVNELMTEVPDARHATALVAVSCRKLWLAAPGDVLVLPAGPPAEFRDYVAERTGTPAAAVEVLVADEPSLQPLAVVLRKAGQLDRLADLIAARPGIELVPFALDRPTLELAAELDLPVAGYAGRPTEATVRKVYELNTKSGFRARAALAGLPVAPGTACTTEAELRSAVAGQLSAGAGAVVKLRRGSNGFGLLFLPAERAAEAGALLDRYLADHRGQPDGWVVERLMPVDQVLTAEMWSDEHGPRVVHLGEMRTPNGSFSGQLTPPPAGTPLLGELTELSLRYGATLHAAGYRGPFDLDAIVSGGDLLFTESNVRRTGTTYLEHLVQRLVRDAGSATWLADSRPGRDGTRFEEAVTGLARAGVAFDGTAGVLLTADTRAVDGRWRYLVVGRGAEQVAELERTAAAVLGVA